MTKFLLICRCLILTVILTGFMVACTDNADNKTDKATKEPDKQTQVQEDAKASTPKKDPAAAKQASVNLESHPGKALHDSNCISCHDSQVYTRKDRKITDFPKLMAQVRRCDANLSTRLFDEEMEQIADYLNQAYYQYPKD